MHWLDQRASDDGRARKIAPFLMLVVISAGLYPALTGRFALHNDWSFLLHLPPGKYVQIFPETRGLIAMMRPLGAALINAQAAFVTSLDTMAASRIFAALLTWILAVVIFRYLRRSQGVPWWLAVGVACSLALLPPLQLYVAWSTNLVPGTLTVTFAALVYLWLERAWPAGRPRPAVVLVVAALLALMMIYPPSALYGLLFTAICLVLGRKNAHALAMKNFIVCSVAMFIYYFLGVAFLNREVVQFPGGNYTFALSDSFFEKSGYLLNILPYVLSLSLGPIFGTTSAAACIIVALIGWGAIGIGSLRRGNSRCAAISAALLVLTFVLSMAPALAAKGDIVGYRLMATPQSIWLVTILAPFVHLGRNGRQPQKVVTGLIIGCFVTLQTALSFANLARTVSNSEREYAVFKRALSDKGEYRAALVVMRPRGRQLMLPPLPLEFGLLAVNGSHALAEFQVAAREVGSPYASRMIPVYFLGGDLSDIPGPAHAISQDRMMLLIDLNSAADQLDRTTH